MNSGLWRLSGDRLVCCAVNQASEGAMTRTVGFNTGPGRKVL